MIHERLKLHGLLIAGIVIITGVTVLAASPILSTPATEVTPAVTPTPEPAKTNPEPAPTQETTPVDPRFMELNNTTAPLNGQDKQGATFALLKKVTIIGESITLGVDEVRWLGGEEAIAAATKDYGCGKPNPTGPCDENGKASTPNGFYIDNPTPKTLNYTLAKDAPIKLITLGFDQGYGLGIISATPEELQQMAEKYPDLPIWIKLNGTTITYLEEQYLP